MSAIIKTEGAYIKLNTEAGDAVVPWWQWTTIHFELVQPFAPDVMEYRFIVKAGTPYTPGQVEIEVRCDDAKEWTPLDTVAWSPDSIIDTRFLPARYAERVRHALFLDIATVEAEMVKAFTAACLEVVDSGDDSIYHPAAKRRDEIATTLRQLRSQFGAATIERRITAEIRGAGSPMTGNDILAYVLNQPGATPAMGDMITAELAQANSSEPGGYLINIGTADFALYGLATVPFSEVQRQAEKKANDNARRAASEAIDMAAARERTAARKAQDALAAADGEPVGAPGLPVAWHKGWDGYHTARCGTAPLTATGDITRSSTGSGAWFARVDSGSAILAESEEAARYALEELLRAAVAKLANAAKVIAAGDALAAGPVAP